MIIETISEVATQLVAGNIRAESIGDVCAQPPDGVKQYVDDILRWIKWGVMAIIIGGGFVSVGALVAGKFGQSGRAAQLGASGLFWTVIGAIAFVCIYAILNGIVGAGC